MKGKRTYVLKGIRVALACIFVLGLTWLLSDATGMARHYVGWMAKVQFMPAVLRVVGGFTFASLLIVLVLLALIWLFGRIYCSVICPLGIMQDVATWLGNRKWLCKLSKRLGPNRWQFAQGFPRLRIIVFIAFVLLLFTLHPIASLLEPYSIYGRIVCSLAAPLNQPAVLVVLSCVMLVGISLWAFVRGRAWCNNVCPVGTLLSFLARHSLFRPAIDVDKCTNCRACERNCKAQCIDIENHSVNLSRCVTCFDCMDNCRFGAMKYSRSVPRVQNSLNTQSTSPSSRRKFLGMVGALAVTGVAEAAHKTTDGGLAIIEDKQVPMRHTPVKPAGSQSLRHFQQHCTACQLCVTACPEKVLRPSTDLTTLLQPEMQFDRGYCLTGCTRCADVCPTGAIQAVSKEEKTTIQIGHAVWIAENCMVETDGVSCGNCARHCPTGAIVMVENSRGMLIPTINSEICIGCGHCEYVCPSRPFSAIYVEGHQKQRRI